VKVRFYPNAVGGQRQLDATDVSFSAPNEQIAVVV